MNTYKTRFTCQIDLREIDSKLNVMQYLTLSIMTLVHLVTPTRIPESLINSYSERSSRLCFQVCKHLIEQV